MGKLRPVSKSQFRVTIAGMTTYWSNSSGIEEKRQVSDYNDGITNRLYQVLSNVKAEPIVLSKPYDPVADAQIVKAYKSTFQGIVDLTITITPVTADPKREKNGAEITLYGANVVGIKGFEVDGASADVSMLELTLVYDHFELSNN